MRGEWDLYKLKETYRCENRPTNFLIPQHVVVAAAAAAAVAAAVAAAAVPELAPRAKRELCI